MGTWYAFEILCGMVTQSRHVKTGNTWNTMNNNFIIFYQWFYQWTISTFLARWFEMDSTDSTDSTGDGHSISTSINLGSATGVLGVLGVTTARWIWVGSNTSSEKLSMSITKLSWDQLVDTWAWFTLLEITASEVTNDQLISIDSQLVIFCASSLAWHLGGKLWGAWVRSLSEKPHQDPCT